MPVREHLWALVCAPFAGVAAIFGKMALPKLVVLYAVFYVCVFMYHCFGAFIGVNVKNRRAVSGLAVGLPILFHIFAGGFFTGFHLTWLPTALWAGGFEGGRGAPISVEMRFFGFPMPVALFDIALMALLGSAFWFAAMRKLRSEETPALTKPVALGYAVLAQVIALGTFWDYVTGMGSSGSSMFRGIPGLLESGFLLLGAGFAMMLAAMGTPTARLYSRMARRAMKHNVARIGPFSDGGLNPFYAALIAIPTAASALLVPAEVPGRIAAGIVTFSAIHAMAALLQWTKLRASRSWPVIFGACLFGLWGVPIILAVIGGMADAGAVPTILLGGLFPGIGIVGAVAEPVAGFIIGIVNLVIGGLLTAFTRTAALTYWTR
jgi:uncharacterized membrane protein